MLPKIGWRIVIGLIETAVICFFFWGSISKLPALPDSTTYSKIGLICGLVSALTWGLSVLGGLLWNAWFNFLAAALAVLSLGYLTKSPF
jgi:hypothetical protein